MLKKILTPQEINSIAKPCEGCKFANPEKRWCKKAIDQRLKKYFCAKFSPKLNSVKPSI